MNRKSAPSSRPNSARGAAEREGIAIVGIGCRIPGGGDSPESVWRLLKDGVDAIRPVPDGRWDIDAFYHPDPKRPGKLYTQAGGYLDDIDLFDAEFFGISPREASQMDPQQRLLLEMAWEAMEDAGTPADALAGSDVGVFIGLSSAEYIHLVLDDLEAVNAYTNVGGAGCIAANRISHFFDFHGPSMAIDTACSSSLVAIHEACQSIWNGEAEFCLAGGINMILKPEPIVGFCKAAMLSPHNRCRSFDAGADGYARAEGGGILALKPLSRAVAEGNPIYALICASATNSDGHTSGIFLPNGSAQEALLRHAYEQAGIRPKDITYIEAHGTGTPAGDPIECKAIGNFVAEERSPDQPCLIGSIKSNVGHLESAAGIAGVIKVALSLKHRVLPGTIHFDKPNPDIRFSDLKLRVVSESTPLPNGRKPAIMGVNSFGFGGANAHVVLQEHKGTSRRDAQRRRARPETPVPLLISARSENSLNRLAVDYADLLRRPDAPALADICHAAAFRRSHLDHRLAVFGTTHEDIARKLEDFARGESADGTVSDTVLSKGAKVAFVFCGNGPQWWGMGQELFVQDALFREAVEKVDAIMSAWAEWSIVDELLSGERNSRMAKTEYAQPALFAVQIGILEVLKSRGLEPDSVVGHSVGEVAAAYASGPLSLKDAVRVIYERSRAQGPTAGQGKMAAMGLPAAEAQALIDDYDGLVLASSNSPSSVTVSGDARKLRELGVALEDRDAFFRILDLNYAFHSAAMDPIKTPLLEALRGLKPRRSTVPFVSTVAADYLDGGKLGASYWWDNVRKPVRFGEAIDRLIDDGHEIFVEIGPHPVLAAYVAECVRAKGIRGQSVPTLRREQPEESALYATIGGCYALGGSIDLGAFFPGPGAHVPLPTYPWDRERYWNVEPRNRADHPLLGHRAPSAEPLWTNRLDTPGVSFLEDHVVQGSVVYPAAGFVEMAIAAAKRTFDGAVHELEDVDVWRPLLIPGDQPPDLQISISPEDGGFRISSRAKGDEGAWAGHVQGKLGAAAVDGMPGPVSIAGLKSRLGRTIAKQDHYRITRDLGLQYGKKFQGVREVWAGSDEALGRVVLPRSLGPDQADYHIHPALLDACFQVVVGVALASVEQGDEVGAAFLPVHIDRLRFCGTSQGLRYCHVRLQKKGQRSIVASLEILDSKGGVIAEIEGFRFQRVGLTGHAVLPLYEFRPELSPKVGTQTAPAMSKRQSPSHLAKKGSKKIRELASERQRPAMYRNFVPRMERLCVGYVARAFKELGAGNAPFTIDSLMAGACGRRAASVPASASKTSASGAAAAQKSGHHQLRASLEAALPDSVKETWPRTRSGRLKVDQRTLRSFADRPEVAALVKDTSAGVLPLYERLLARYVALLAEASVIRETAAGWVFGEKVDLPDTDHLWRQLVRDYPASLAELLLVGRCGTKLAAILTGQADPLESLSLGTLEHLYESDPEFEVYNAAIADVVGELVRTWPANRTLKILEIGAGTGGVASSVLPCLPEDRTEYVFTDVSDVFLTRAEGRFSDHSFVRYALLDIERDPAEQGFAGQEYDLVIAANVLHATTDLRRTLQSVRGLIRPGGQLMLLEAHEVPGLDLTFALLKDWWKFEDLEVRQSWPLLAAEKWSSLFAELGFEDVATLNDGEVNLEPAQSVILARKGDEDAAAGEEAPGDAEEKRAWLALVDSDTDSRGQSIADALTRDGHRVVTVRPGEEFARPGPNEFVIPAADPKAFQRLCRTLKADGASCDDVLHFWGFSTTAIDSPDGLMALQDRRCLSTVRFLQALQKADWPRPPRLWLLTSGAVHHPRQRIGIDPAQAPLWGLGRVIANEYPDVACKLVDLHPDHDAADVDKLLLAELRDPDDEDEILLSKGTRHVNRVRRVSLEGQAEKLQAKTESGGEPVPFQLDFRAQGSFDNLYLRAFPVPKPGEGEVLIEVKATGLNFHDIMTAMGLLPDEALEVGFAGATLGMECAGEITAVGPRVQDFRTGERVIAFAPSCFSSHVVAPTSTVAPMPADLSFAEAATIPTVFFTAFYALDTLAQLQAGERVLIHGAAGGVGLAAIQIAKLRGAEVFATAGTDEKRDFVRMMGADHVLNSRSLAFADEIMKLTDGEGVDAVLNSLAGEAIYKSLILLKPFGRFLELGKRDFYANSKLGLRPFRNNISYFAIDADQFMVERPELASRIFREVLGLFDEGVLYPLVHRTFPISRVADAFRHMQQSKHIGKIVVAMDQGNVDVASRERRKLSLEEDGTYLVTGGLTGFGLASAKWLVEKGARNLVLIGRRGASTAEARAGIAEMEATGAKVVVAKADVSKAADLGRVLKDAGEKLPPLKGILHAAMVLDDVALMNARPEQFRRVFEPKILGAWNLHRLTQHMPLDFFVLYSSGTTIVGNPGQGNYVAACHYLEALAWYRRSRSLPALAVSWGAIDDVGYLARKKELKETLLRRSGFRAITAREALDRLEQLILSGAIHVAPSDFSWPTTLKALPAGGSPKFAYMRGEAGDEADDAGQPDAFKDLLLALPEEERLEVATQLIAEQLAKVLRMPVAKLDVDRSILDMGVDSLMAVELQLTMEKQFGVDLPTMEVMGGISTAQLASRVLELAMIPSSMASSDRPELSEEVFADLAGQVDELSDEAVDAYLEKTLAEDGERVGGVT